MGSCDATSEDNDKTRNNLAGGDEPLAIRGEAQVSEPAHALDVQWFELGKYLIASKMDRDVAMMLRRTR